MSKNHHPHEHVDCNKILSELNEYADESLPPELCVELEAHLADCENCQIVLDTLKKTIYLVRRLDDETPPMPAQVEQRLFASLELGDFLLGSKGIGQE